jgi:hypothetical protein
VISPATDDDGDYRERLRVFEALSVSELADFIAMFGEKDIPRRMKDRDSKLAAARARNEGW